MRALTLSTYQRSHTFCSLRGQTTPLPDTRTRTPQTSNPACHTRLSPITPVPHLDLPLETLSALIKG